jgi:hypothetical protein
VDSPTSANRNARDAAERTVGRVSANGHVRVQATVIAGDQLGDLHVDVAGRVRAKDHHRGESVSGVQQDPRSRCGDSGGSALPQRCGSVLDDDPTSRTVTEAGLCQWLGVQGVEGVIETADVLLDHPDRPRLLTQGEARRSALALGRQSGSRNGHAADDEQSRARWIEDV